MKYYKSIYIGSFTAMQRCLNAFYVLKYKLKGIYKATKETFDILWSLVGPILEFLMSSMNI